MYYFYVLAIENPRKNFTLVTNKNFVIVNDIKKNCNFDKKYS